MKNMLLIDDFCHAQITEMKLLNQQYSINIDYNFSFFFHYFAR